MKDTIFGKILLNRVKMEIEKTAGTNNPEDPTYKMLYKMQTEMPLRVLSDFSGGSLSYPKLMAILDFTNKKYIAAMRYYLNKLFHKNKEL